MVKHEVKVEGVIGGWGMCITADGVVRGGTVGCEGIVRRDEGWDCSLMRYMDPGRRRGWLGLAYGVWLA